jgi:hypothetical protein
VLSIQYLPLRRCKDVARFELFGKGIHRGGLRFAHALDIHVHGEEENARRRIALDAWKNSGGQLINALRTVSAATKSSIADALANGQFDAVAGLLGKAGIAGQAGAAAASSASYKDLANLFTQ